MSRLRSSLVGAAALGLLSLRALPAAAVDYQAKQLVPPDAAVDQFGAAVAVGDGVVAVGAYLSDMDGKDSGAVYLYRKVGTEWKLFPWNMPLHQGPGEWFGFDVAIQGNQLVVGAPHPGRGSGAAYVYSFDLQAGTVVQEASLNVPGARNGDEVGSAVAIDGNQVAVGARGAEGRSGRVYVFSVAGGQPTKTLPATLPPAGVELGQSVALRGNLLVAGAPLPGKDAQATGMAYVFQLQTGTTDLLRPPSDLKRGAAFGYSVAIAGSNEDPKVWVGAPLAALGGEQSGAVYLFPGGKIPIESAAGDQLGVAVAAEGDSAVIGARGADGKKGIAYLYDRSTSSLKPEPRVDRAEFGFGTAIHGQTIVVGAFEERGRGAVYVFEPSQPQTVTLHLEQLAATAPVRFLEGTTTSVTVVVKTSDGGALRADASANLTSSGTAQTSDYTVGQVRFPAGTPSDTKLQVPVSILPDCEAEPNETLILELSDASGATIEPGTPIKLTIVDSAATDGILLILPPETERVTRDSGTTVDLKVRLTCQPSAVVTLTFSSTRPEEGKVLSPESSSLVFTPITWSVEQTVTIQGQKDDDADCIDETYGITIAATSDDLGYQGLATDPVVLTNDEDEDACISIGAEAEADACSNEDGTVQYTVEIENTGDVELSNLAGPEILEALPEKVTVVTASADRGVATVDYVANEVAWNGSIPVGAKATIRILATLEPEAELGEEVNFEGVYRYDGGEAEFEASFTVGLAAPCSAP